MTRRLCRPRLYRSAAFKRRWSSRTSAALTWLGTTFLESLQTVAATWMLSHTLLSPLIRPSRKQPISAVLSTLVTLTLTTIQCAYTAHCTSRSFMTRIRFVRKHSLIWISASHGHRALIPLASPTPQHRILHSYLSARAVLVCLPAYATRALRATGFALHIHGLIGYKVQWSARSHRVSVPVCCHPLLAFAVCFAIASRASFPLVPAITSLSLPILDTPAFPSPAPFPPSRTLLIVRARLRRCRCGARKMRARGKYCSHLLYMLYLITHRAASYGARAYTTRHFPSYPPRPRIS